MKSYRGYAGFVGRLRRPARFWLRSLQAAAVALLLALPIGTKATAAVPAQNGTAAHVYLLRGVLNVFSLGLDEIAARLQAQGIPVTVVNYLGWASLADEAAAEYRAGRVRFPAEGFAVCEHRRSWQRRQRHTDRRLADVRLDTLRLLPHDHHHHHVR